MEHHDLRDIQLFGTLCLITGIIILILTAVGVILILATGGSDLAFNLNQGLWLVGTLTVLNSSLIGLGGELQRSAHHTAAARENLRLTWTALLIVLVACFLVGIVLLPILAGFAAVMIIGLTWIRQPIIRITSR